MHFLLGDFKRAVECYRRAVTILPDYAYAWGDLFLAYQGLAEHGEIDLVGLRQALEQMKATGTDQPLVTASVAEYESHLRKWVRRARSQLRHPRSPSRAPTNRDGPPHPKLGQSALTHTDSRPGPGLKGGRDGRGEIPVKSSANRMLKNPILVPPSSNGDVLAPDDNHKRFQGWTVIKHVNEALNRLPEPMAEKHIGDLY